MAVSAYLLCSDVDSLPLSRTLLPISTGRVTAWQGAASSLEAALPVDNLEEDSRAG
jgi:hypothetical protein